MRANPNATTSLRGQDTLIACWRALAALSADARVTRVGNAEVALFPAWSPLNNAIMLEAGVDLGADAARATAVLTDLYASANVGTWALWIPSPAVGFGAPDRVTEVGGLRRDTTTLVMNMDLSGPGRRDARVVPTSVASVTRVGVDAMTASDLEAPDGIPGLTGWALVHDRAVVAAAWTFLHDRDCGIYGVETIAEQRRRGFGTALMQHLLTDARERGVETATLQSTAMGVHLYETLGFEAVGRYEEWVHGCVAPGPTSDSSSDNHTRSRSRMPSIVRGSGYPVARVNASRSTESKRKPRRW
jgi:GNAT superfamily N-acetyltransferase